MSFGDLSSSNSMQPLKLAVKSLLLIDILFKAATRNNILSQSQFVTTYMVKIRQI